MRYIFIDSNLYIRLITQGRPGCEQQHFDSLKTLVEEGLLTLVVPEVVQLEIDKHFDTMEKKFESECDSLLDSVGKAAAKHWNELDSLKGWLLDQIKTHKTTMMGECPNRISAVRWLTSQNHNVVHIPLTADIMVDAKRRRIAGKLPEMKPSSDQDALIVSSLASYFATIGTKGEQLLFCSENTVDFAQEVEDVNKQRAYILHPHHWDGLPPAYFYTDLNTALAFAIGVEQCSFPSGTDDPNIKHIETQIEAAEEMLADTAEMSRDWVNLMSLIQDLEHKRLGELYTSTVVPGLPDMVRQQRESLNKEIQQLLHEGRSLPTWNDRSEGKLFQWCENMPEALIPYTSLPTLVRIRNSLQRFIGIHKNESRLREMKREQLQEAPPS